MRRALHALSAMMRGPQWPLVALSGVSWAVMVVIVLQKPIAMICGAPAHWQALGLDARLTGPLPLLAVFAVMLGAMMTPLLAHNLSCVQVQSFSARRLRATALFGLGYSLPWIVALSGLWVLSGLLAAAVRHDYAALGFAVGLCLVWQGTPAKAMALRQCHLTPALDAFGLRADWSSFAYGVRSAGWCIAACWLWMLAPFTYAPAHLWLMGAVFVIMLAERYAEPPPLRLRPVWMVSGVAMIATTALADIVLPRL
jgi:hypothetical protein